MPYLDMSDADNFVHLYQLFLATHPHYQQENEKMRAHTGLADEYFLSLPMAREVAAWARERRLLRRKDAARLVEVAERIDQSGDAPASRGRPHPRLLGEPPRRQLTVLSTSLQGWLFLTSPVPQPGEIVYALALPAAIELLTRYAEHPDTAAPLRTRAQHLRDWLVQREPPA
jgi:hypothetical protein